MKIYIKKHHFLKKECIPPWVWAWRPTRPDPPQLPPCVWAWKTSRHAGIPPPPWRPAARHAGILPAMHAGIAHTPVDRHTCKNITFANYVCGW